MAETRLTNAQIDPEVFSAYTVEPAIQKSRLFRSGVVAQNAFISQSLAGNGETYALPFWKDISGTSGDIPSETVATSVNNLTSGKQIFRKQLREKAWGSNALVSIFAGDNPMDKLADMVNNYWAQAFDILTVKSAIGVFADDAADAGELINDISGETGNDAIISSDAVISAQGLLGENGVVGSSDLNGGDFVAIAVHPKTYEVLRKQNAFDFLPISDQERPVAFYMGMQVIVDRNMPVAGAVYDSYIFKAGAFQFGISGSGYIPTEMDRDSSTGFGIDKLYTRRVFGLHPVGFAWQEAGSYISPADTDLISAAEWDRVFSAENSRMVAIKHKIA